MGVLVSLACRGQTDEAYGLAEGLSLRWVAGLGLWVLATQTDSVCGL